MKEFKDLQVGDYIKCIKKYCTGVDRRIKFKSVTKGRIYQIKSFSPYCAIIDSNFQIITCNIINDIGGESTVQIYHLTSEPIKKITRNWKTLFIPKIEWEILKTKEEINFLPADEYEVDAQKYNL